MHRDPINWAAVVERLQEWCPEVEIPKSTDSLFRERVVPTHLPRSLPLNRLTRQLRADIPGVFSFHRPHAHAVDAKQLRRANLPPIVSSALIKINRHKFSLLALGILPNELRKLVRKEKADSEACLDHLRKIFFWGSYRIWKTRKALVTSYWESLQASKVKPKKKSRGQCESGCKSPFHFLVKSVDLSKQRLTRCPCSRIIQPLTRPQFRDIRPFFTPKSSKQEFEVKSGLDMKHLPGIKPQTLSLHMKTRTQAILREHDRGKERKFTQLKLLNHIIDHF